MRTFANRIDRLEAAMNPGGAIVFLRVDPDVDLNRQAAAVLGRELVPDDVLIAADCEPRTLPRKSAAGYLSALRVFGEGATNASA